MSEQVPLRIGIVVGETSGAILALGMLKQVFQRYPNCVVEGIGSSDMQSLGMRSLFDMNELSVMGLIEVIKHLPRLLHIRKSVIQHFLNNPPDLFIGVDAPDFNLKVETELKAAGIPTVHYVSPTVWAWREKRIYKIAKATNLVLGVFPFEEAIYQKYALPFSYVGHTMADNIPLDIDQNGQRAALQLPISEPLMAILPGSRSREVGSLLNIFIDTFLIIKRDYPSLKAIIPAVNDAREDQIRSIILERRDYNEIQSDITITKAPARSVMMASDLVLLASGTAALEAMLCKRPMVVAYKMSWLTYQMMKHLYKPDYFALPNILANQQLVPEFLQEQVNPQNLAKQLVRVWQQDNEQIVAEFNNIHKSLKRDADKQSATAVLELIGK